MKKKRILGVAGAAAAALCCMKPNHDQERRQRLGPFEDRRVAHRGLHDNENNIPENSLAAFDCAVTAGFAIELDVRLTKDGQLAVIHDATMKRVAKVNKQVAEMTLAEVQAYPLFGTEQRVPSFEEALSTIDGKVPLVVEIKASTDVDAICIATWEQLRAYRGVYCVISFSPLALAWFKKHAPAVLRGQLAMDFFDPWKQRKEPWPVKFSQTYLLTNCISKPDFIAYEFKGAEKVPLVLVRKVFHGATAGWTVRSQAEMDYADRFFDIVVFEGFCPTPKK